MTLVAQVSHPRRPPWPQISTMLVEAGTNLRQLTLSRIEYPTLGYNVEPVRCSLVGRPCPSKAGAISHPQAYEPKSPSTSVQDPSQLQGGPLSGPTLSPTPSAPTCLATGRPESIVTFSRPRSVKSWTSRRGAWHGHNKNPIPDLMVGSHVKACKYCFPLAKTSGRQPGLETMEIRSKTPVSTMLFAHAWCHVQGRAGTKAPGHWILNRMPPSSTERAR